MVIAVSPLPATGLVVAVTGGEGWLGQGTAPQHQTGRPHLPASFRTLLGDKREAMEREVERAVHRQR